MFRGFDGEVKGTLDLGHLAEQAVIRQLAEGIHPSEELDERLGSS